MQWKQCLVEGYFLECGFDFVYLGCCDDMFISDYQLMDCDFLFVDEDDCDDLLVYFVEDGEFDEFCFGEQFVGDWILQFVEVVDDVVFVGEVIVDLVG